MISVIMPSLNVGKYIEKCIKSVCEQTYTDLEIIFVDAGSTDETLDIINDFASKDSRIKIIHSDYKSYGHQMNLGIDNAHGDYIGIVETDDYIASDMYEKLYECITDAKVDFVKSGYFYLAGKDDHVLVENCNGRSVENLHREVVDLDINPEYRFADMNHIWTGLYNRNFLNDNGIRFNETPGASFQDTSFSILVGLLAKYCIYLNDAYYYYRIDRLESSVKTDTKSLCIIDEYRYIDDFCAKKGIKHQEIINLINQTKIMAYFWNASRLSMNPCYDFLEKIHEELLALREDSLFYEGLKEIQKQALDLMMAKNAKAISDRRRDIRNIEVTGCIKWSIDCGGVVCVGAGKFMKNLLDIQNIGRNVFIKSIADNNPQLHNTNLEGYTIMPVNEMVRRYRNEKYLVVSARFSEDIKNQLVSLGIGEKQIKLLTKVPGWVGYCVE